MSDNVFACFSNSKTERREKVSNSISLINQSVAATNLFYEQLEPGFSGFSPIIIIIFISELRKQIDSQCNKIILREATCFDLINSSCREIAEMN